MRSFPPTNPVPSRGLALAVTLVVTTNFSLTSSAQSPESSGSPVSIDSSDESANDGGFVEIEGDGETDVTDAVQAAVDSGRGDLRFRKGMYRITRPIVIELDRVGFTSIHGGGVARFVMEGPGPAFRIVGTHDGTAAPHTVSDDVWQRQRTPMVDGIEIVGGHPEACGVEARGTMQLTLTRLVVREALHAVHLIDRNRNVTLSACHLYHNRGVGVFLDRLNLHQINIANCHISYNAGGGVVAKRSEIRNLQIGNCDIEGNLGGEDSEPTANVWLDSTDSSIGEVAIVGCTIQHDHVSPDSANIRIDGESTPRPFTDERRHGNVTIANNVLSDVQTNLDLRNVRGIAITGNTMWKGYTANVTLERCSQVVMTGNVFDRNPRYHYGDGSAANNGVVLTDCEDCTISANHSHGVVHGEAAWVIRRCRRVNLTACSILDYGGCGLFLDDVAHSRVSGCIIRDDREDAEGRSIQMRKVTGSMIRDNLLGEP